jgi:hypothetical protein
MGETPSKRGRVVGSRVVRRPHSAWVALVASGIVLGVGCYDFSSVSGGSKDGGTDASTGSSGGGSSSGGSSGGSSSGGGSSGGADDGSTASDAGGGFCASQPTPQPPAITFCDDFDDYTGMTLSKWDQTIQTVGSVGLTTISPWSKPNAMSAQTGIAAVGEYPEADVLKGFTNLAGKNLLIKASFEMNIQQWDQNTTGRIIAFEVIFKNSSAQYNQIVINLLSLGSGGVSAQVAENAYGEDGGTIGYFSYPFPDHPATNAWTKVEMTINVPNATGSQSNTVSVSVGGMTEIQGQALQIPIQGGAPTAHLGIGFVQTPATAWAVQYDDFLLNISQF